MKDKMQEIYELFKANSTIFELANDQIYPYEAPENVDASNPFIVIAPLEVIAPRTHGSDKELTQTMSYQINVETLDRMTTKQLSKSIHDVLTSNGFSQLNGGLDEYFNETKRYVDARRYRTITNIYDTDY